MENTVLKFAKTVKASAYVCIAFILVWAAAAAADGDAATATATATAVTQAQPKEVEKNKWYSNRQNQYRYLRPISQCRRYRMPSGKGFQFTGYVSNFEASGKKPVLKTAF